MPYENMAEFTHVGARIRPRSGFAVIDSVTIKFVSNGPMPLRAHSHCRKSTAKGGAMLLFDLYMFDDEGRVFQQIPIQAASQEGAREKARYLQKTQRAAKHVLMPFVRPGSFVPPSTLEVEAHHRLLQARDQLRR